MVAPAESRRTPGVDVWVGGAMISMRVSATISAPRANWSGGMKAPWRNHHRPGAIGLHWQNERDARAGHIQAPLLEPAQHATALPFRWQRMTEMGFFDSGARSGNVPRFGVVGIRWHVARTQHGKDAGVAAPGIQKQQNQQ